MFLFEMKSIFTKEIVLDTTFRLILFIVIVTTSGQCIPRQSLSLDRTYEELKRKSPQVMSDMDSDIPLLSKNKLISHNVLDYREEKMKKEKSVVKALPSFATQSKKYVDSERDVESLFVESQPEPSFHPKRDTLGSTKTKIGDEYDKGNRELGKIYALNDSDSLRFRRKESLSHSNTDAKPHSVLTLDKNLHEETTDNDDDFITENYEPRIDIILNGLNSQKPTGSDTVIDYFFVDDAGDINAPAVPRHGVIINLRGLIPAETEDDEDDVIKENPFQDEEYDERKNDEVLAFKAFEISSSPLSGDPGRSVSEFDEQFVKEAVSVKSPKVLTSSNTPHLESRNLSRKRRQKASPNQEDVTDCQRRCSRKRRRKRKRRLRHSPKGAEAVESERSKVLQESLFLLRPSGPAYVIASAKEVKKGWCRTVPLKQKITETNCKPRVMMNNFCYGQCNSFFIPYEGRTGDGAAFQSYAFCKPHKSRWSTVTLHCPGQTPPKVEKRILVVESCRCQVDILQ